jgi:putative phosphoesterase
VSEKGVMRVGVLSDSHVTSLAPELLEKLRVLNLDLIIHCGDYTGIDVVHQLQSLGKFCGVAGNMDSMAIRTQLKEKEIIEVEGRRFAIFHGHGTFFLDKGLKKQFKGKKIDVYIHGHTHHLRKEKKEGVYYVNPGRFPSMLIINLERGKEIDIETMTL